MNLIINLTQHEPTSQQIATGVRNPCREAKKDVVELLTFDEIPTATEIEERAERLAMIAHNLGAEAAMIGGAPFLMAPLERALIARGVVPLYAFSRRESVEETQPDGSVTKNQVFRHLGFIQA